MKDMPTVLPNTLPPLSRRDFRGCFVFGGRGLVVLLIGLFPNLRPPPRAACPWLSGCWRYLRWV